MTPQRAAIDKKNIPPIFLYDENIRLKKPVVAGVDEAGRGPLAGPVVAAAVILSPGFVMEGLRDSKQIVENERKKFFWDIVYNAIEVGIGIIGADVIDKINILKSTKLAMEKAVRDLKTRPDILIIDAVRLTDVNIMQYSIIKGESISASVAAASIVAKVVRDDIMLRYHEKYPIYNFKRHKGYSTKEHIERIRLHGPCPIHRKSFRKVMNMGLPLNLSLTNDD